MKANLNSIKACKENLAIIITCFKTSRPEKTERIMFIILFPITLTITEHLNMILVNLINVCTNKTFEISFSGDKSFREKQIFERRLAS